MLNKTVIDNTSTLPKEDLESLGGVFTEDNQDLAEQIRRLPEQAMSKGRKRRQSADRVSIDDLGTIQDTDSDEIY